MIDIRQERLLSIPQVCDRVPGKRGGVVYHTVWHWMRKGVCGVVLESSRVGGRIYTSEEALQRFLQALSGGDRGVMDATNTVPISSDPCLAASPLAGTSQPAPSIRRPESASERRQLKQVCRDVQQKYGLK